MCTVATHPMASSKYSVSYTFRSATVVIEQMPRDRMQGAGAADNTG